MAVGSTVDVVMPQMGVSVSEGTVSRWLKAVGDRVEADETIVEISTDKVDTEVPSPASGIVAEILVPEGETVPVETRLAVIQTGDGPAPAAGDDAPEAPAEAAAAAAARGRGRARRRGAARPPSDRRPTAHAGEATSPCAP